MPEIIRAIENNEVLVAGFHDELKGKGFFAIGQCGFPDDTLLRPLLASCRLFAEANGMKWAGGLGFGGGPMINGASIESLGGRGKKISDARSPGGFHESEGQDNRSQAWDRFGRAALP